MLSVHYSPKTEKACQYLILFLFAGALFSPAGIGRPLAMGMADAMRL